MRHDVGWFRLAAVLLVCSLCGSLSAAPRYGTQHVFIVVMDGVRWMDTFGDPTHANIPHLYNDLRPLGTLYVNYYDRGITVTRQGHSTIISGTWQMVQNGGARLTRPTLFEYLRDEKGIPPTKAWSVFGKARYSFEPYSSHPAYGAQFAASHIGGGGPDRTLNEETAEGDVGVLNKVVEIMQRDQPDLFFINFGYTDHAGHIAQDISEYQAAIRNCDEQFWNLWNAIQADPYYRDTTTVFFTNDHGRHTEDFHGHGDHCAECEHIMLLAVGPDTKADTVVDTEALEIDVAPTAGELLGLQTPLAKGRVLTECLTRPLGLNQSRAVTAAAREAVKLEKLASRDLVKVAADYVVEEARPRQLAADAPCALLARGMLRAYTDKEEPKYLLFVRRWLDAHRNETPPPPALGEVIVELPPDVQPSYLPLARQIGDSLLAVEVPTALERAAALADAAFLGRLGQVTEEARYTDGGLALAKAALALPAPRSSDALPAALDLVQLGGAARAFPGDETVKRAYVLALFQALQGLPEQGRLWDDPTVSVVNLAAIVAAQRGSVLKDFTQPKGNAPLPPIVEAMTVPEAAALFAGAKPAAPRRQLVNLVVQCAKQSLPFSRDRLRYGVDAEGAYADGSPLAQGGFLMAYQPLQWRYGGNTWPGAATVDVGKVNMGPPAPPR